jgi:hypothetical protein
MTRKSSLAPLIRLYFHQINTFNTRPFRFEQTDEEANTLARATYEKTLRQIIGVPVRTAEDAVAAFDFLVREKVDLGSEPDWPSDFGKVTHSLVDSLRSYLAASA